MFEKLTKCMISLENMHFSIVFEVSKDICYV